MHRAFRECDNIHGFGVYINMRCEARIHLLEDKKAHSTVKNVGLNSLAYEGVYLRDRARMTSIRRCPLAEVDTSCYRYGTSEEESQKNEYWVDVIFARDL